MGKTRLSLSAQQQGDLFIKSSGNPVHNISIPLELIFATLRRLKDADKGRKKAAMQIELSLSTTTTSNMISVEGKNCDASTGPAFLSPSLPIALQNGGRHAQIGKKGLVVGEGEGGAIMNLKP